MLSELNIANLCNTLGGIVLVSSKDVAKKAGVSQTTVSRVLNAPELVKDKTRKKVERAMKELKYIPNANARLLVQEKTGVITLLSGPLYNPFFVETTSEIVNYANSRGYRINVQFVQDDEVEEAYSSAIQNRIDGIILSCIFLEDSIFEELTNLSIPFITFNRKHGKEKFFVEIDNEKAGYLAAEHLIKLGHKKFAWIGGTLSVSTFYNRYQGFLNACKDYDIQLDNDYIIHHKASKNQAQQVYHYLMSLSTPPTAICGGSDSIALNLMDVAIQNGKSIPKDISIIGIDNTEKSRHGAIRLTSVGSISEKNLGLIAIKKLIEMIENKNNTCIQITESVKIFPRSTTARI